MPHRSHRLPGWRAPFGAALAVGFLAFSWGCGDEPLPRRTVEPRFAGGLRYAECRQGLGVETIGCAEAEPNEPFRWRGSSTVAEEDRRQAIEPILQLPDLESLDDTFDALRETLGRHPEDPSSWSDYAATLLLRYRAGGSAFDLFEALEAIERAIDLDLKLTSPTHSGSAEAWFNLALILEEFGLRSEALHAWEKASQLEHDPQWQAEIANRRDALYEQRSFADSWEELRNAPWESQLGQIETTVDRFPWRSHRWLIEELLPRLATETLRANESREPREAAQLLADRLAQRGTPFAQEVLRGWPSSDDRPYLQAIVELGQGLHHLEVLEPEAGREALDRALPILRSRSSPLELSAAAGLATADYFVDTAAALAAVDELLLGPAAHYPFLLGRLGWLRGTLLGRQGEYLASRRAYSDALAVVEPIYGPHPATTIRVLAGEVATLDGRLEESWEAFARDLPEVFRTGTRRRIHAALFTIGTTLQEIGFHHAARRLFSEAVANAKLWGTHYGLASSGYGLGVSEHRLGALERATTAFQQARAAVAAIEDRALRQLTVGDLAVEEAALYLGEYSGEKASSDEAATAQHRESLGRAIVTFRELGSNFDEVRGRLALARFNSATGSAPTPASFERIQKLLADVDPAPIDRPGTVGAGLAQLAHAEHALALHRLGDDSNALLAAERAQLFSSGMGTQPEANLIQRLHQLADTTDAVMILLLDHERPVAWTLSAQDLKAHELSTSSTTLRQRAAQLQAATPEQRRKILQELASELLPTDLKLAGRYIFVAGRDFAAIPFAALPHPATGEPLIETGSVGSSPTLSLLLRKDDRSGAEGPSLVVVAADTEDELPAAQEEARFVASRMANSILLDSPSRDELLRHLARAPLFHFSGHLRADLLAPYHQELLLGTQGKTLSSKTILGLDLSHLQLAVLSSCNSASAGAGPLHGPSYADAFLLSGAHQVVGTLWQVLDSPSRELMTDFWEAMDQGLSPLDALATAARAARDRDPWGTSNQPPVWMAYRIEGRVLARPVARIAPLWPSDREVKTHSNVHKIFFLGLEKLPLLRYRSC